MAKTKQYHVCKKTFTNQGMEKPSAIEGNEYSFPTKQGLTFINEFGEPHEITSDFKKEHFYR